MVRGEPIGSVVVVRFNEAGQTARIVVNHRPLRSVLLWSQLMGEHFADTPYAKHFLSHDAAEAIHEGGRSYSGATRYADGGVETPRARAGSPAQFRLESPPPREWKDRDEDRG